MPAEYQEDSLVFVAYNRANALDWACSLGARRFRWHHAVSMPWADPVLLSRYLTQAIWGITLSEMRPVLTCPRCDSVVREPSVWSSAYHCGQHGEVHPLRSALSPSQEGLDGVLRQARVPVWVPWPLPQGWLVTGFAAAGDDRTGTRGCSVALSGPNPVGGPAEMMLISEEPGVGLGARFAGLDGPDPGSHFAKGPPAGVVQFANHELPLWNVDTQGRAAFAGEVSGNWLWLVLWPDTAGMILVEPLPLRDLRDPGQDLDLPFGALSPQLPG
jgi:hypothetical protein